MAKRNYTNKRGNSKDECTNVKDSSNNSSGNHNSGSSRSNSKRKGSSKNRGRDNDKEEYSKSSAYPTGHGNDVSWYLRNVDLTRDAVSNITFNRLGQPLPSDISGTYTSSFSAVPGICSLNFVPTMGDLEDAESVANQAARLIYTFIRTNVKGRTATYQASDIMLHLMAVDSIYIALAWLKRLYGVINTYDMTNLYIARGLIQSMGVNYDSIQIQSPAAILTWLNKAITRMSVYRVPGNMSLFQRHTWMVSEIYTDDDVTKPQIYMFNPTWLWQFRDTGSSGGELFAAQSRPYLNTGTTHNLNVGLDIGQVMRGIDSMITALNSSASAMDIQGDLIAVYGINNMFTIGTVPPDYTVTPVYNPEVLDQMSNAYSSCTVDDSTSKIVQDPTNDLLKYQFSASANIKYNEPGHVVCINSHKADFTAFDMIENTRLIAGFEYGTATQTGEYPVTKLIVGSELFTGFDICVKDPVTVSGVSYPFSFPYVNIHTNGEASNNVPLTATLLRHLVVFRYAPLFHPITSYGGTNYDMGEFRDFANYTVQDIKYIEDLHTACIYSEFDVPQIMV